MLLKENKLMMSMKPQKMLNEYSACAVCTITNKLSLMMQNRNEGIKTDCN